MIGQYWKHKKRGSLYVIVSESAQLQCASAPAFETVFAGAPWVVYRNTATGQDWIRLKSEFLDGRFEQVHP